MRNVGLMLMGYDVSPPGTPGESLKRIAEPRDAARFDIIRHERVPTPAALLPPRQAQTLMPKPIGFPRTASIHDPEALAA
jgi:hypothetical protein